MVKWTATMSYYKGQFKISIPKELARLARLTGVTKVNLGLNKQGEIVMEVFNGYEKVKIQSSRNIFNGD